MAAPTHFHSERARSTLRQRGDARALVARAQGRARAAAVDRGAARAARARHRRARRRAIEAYEAVVDQVDLASIRARERVTRHDVKARIEEFCALAGHEHIHKGMTSRDLTENVEQMQVRAGLVAGARSHGGRARAAGRARRRSTRRVVMTGAHPQRAGAGDHARQALRQRRRGAAARASRASKRCSRAIRCAGSRARSARSRISSTCSAAIADKLAQLEAAVARHLGFARVLDQRRPGVSALARLRGGERAPAGRAPGRRASRPRCA